jgi:YD repeat-containing protein
MSIDPSTGAMRMSLNLGDGAFTSPETLPPLGATELVTFTGDGLRLADINGDGLTDLVALRDNGVRVWLSTGYGAFTQGKSMASAPSLSPGERARTQIGDATGDGLADLLLVESGQARIWENIAGSGFSPSRVLTGLPELRPTTQVRMADMNGNGSSDIVWIDPTNAQPWRTLDLLADGSPGFLTQIDSGLGKVTTLNYRGLGFMRSEARRLGIPWDKRCPIGQMMVSQIEHSDSLGTLLTSELRYADAFYDGERREFRGFAKAIRTEIGDEEQPSLVSIMAYDVGESDEARKGLLVSATSTTDSGVIFERVIHTHAVKTLGQGRLGLQTSVPLRFAFETEKRSQIFEGGDIPVEVLERFSYDDYGNVTRHEELGVVEGANNLAGNDERVTVRQYAVNESAWILRSASTVEIQSIDGTRLSMTRSYFDNLPLGQIGTRGRVTKGESWIEADRFGLDVRTEYSAAGNPVALWDARGGHTSVKFDETQTFVIAAEQSVDEERSLLFSATYDKGLGVMLTAADPNGVGSAYRYDDLGRLTAEIAPDRFPISAVRCEKLQESLARSWPFPTWTAWGVGVARSGKRRMESLLYRD